MRTEGVPLRSRLNARDRASARQLAGVHPLDVVRRLSVVLQRGLLERDDPWIVEQFRQRMRLLRGMPGAGHSRVGSL
ncbi:hypothetical protein GCM10023096_17920 [Nonomuraea ferruginea]